MKNKKIKCLTKAQKQVISTIALHIVSSDVVAVLKNAGAEDADQIMRSIINNLTPQEHYIMAALKSEVERTKDAFLKQFGIDPLESSNQ